MSSGANSIKNTLTYFFKLTRILQVKSKVIEKKNVTGCEDGRCQTFFVPKSCQSHGKSLGGNAGGGDWETPSSSPPPMKRVIVGIQNLIFSFLTQCSLHRIASCVCASCLSFSFAVLACNHMSLPALFGFIYKNCTELSQIILYESEIMKSKTYIALNSEKDINTHFKNTLTYYTKSVVASDTERSEST